MVFIEFVDFIMIFCYEVFFFGILCVGNLLIGLLWDDLIVYGVNGRFYFEIIEVFNINWINVSGLMVIGLVFRFSVFFIGDLFIVE